METFNSMTEVRKVVCGEASDLLDMTDFVECEEFELAWSAFLDRVSRMINEANRSPHTIKNWITAARNELSQALDGAENASLLPLFFRKEVIRRVRLSNENLQFVTGRAIQRQDERASGVIVLSEEWLNGFLQEVHSKLSTDDLVGMVCYTLVTTGRRPAECLSTFFSECDGAYGQSDDGNGRPAVWFTGQLKKRGKASGAYSIPLLVGSPEDWHAEDPYSSQFHRRISSMNILVSNPRIRRRLLDFERSLSDANRWPSEEISLTPKALRSLYACATYHLYAPANEQEWHWVNRVLGHEEGDTETCQTYMRFRFDG